MHAHARRLLSILLTVPLWACAPEGTASPPAGAATPAPAESSSAAPTGREGAGGAATSSDAAPVDGASFDATGSGAPMGEAAMLERFRDSPEDAGADTLLGVTQAQVGKHYLAGNEKGLHVYQPHIEGLGGGYVGVGSDQAYLLMGWMRPEWAWLVDYDPQVVRIHDAYQAFILAAETPGDFVALWSRDAKDEGVALLRARYEGERLVQVETLYLEHRTWIHRRLTGLTKRQARLKVSSFLNDQDDYDAVKALIAAGHVRPMVANLLESGAIEGVGAAARDMGVPIRLLYLSNAEEYWKAYPDAFRTNVRALPFDERSLVLRCLLTWQENQDYWYNLQSAANFLEWLAQPWFEQVYEMARRPKLKEGEPRPRWWLVVTEGAPKRPRSKQ